MPRVVTAAIPRTPTSSSSAAILMSSPVAGTTSTHHHHQDSIFQVKQEEIEYQLLSPISASSPSMMSSGGLHGNPTKIIRVTPTAVTRKFNDHEYFSTPITPSSGATPTSRIWMTPVQSPASTSATVANSTKVEARRRLNLDSALVDRDGFKTPIKGTKRKHDFSSPSPKKRKSFQ